MQRLDPNMPRGAQVGRFYALVLHLAESRRGVPAATLATKHRYPLRSVYRDLHALVKAGFPIVQVAGAKWKLVDGWEQRIPFPLPLEHLLALHLARGLMGPLRGTRVARDLDALIERLSGTPPASAAQGDLFPKLRNLISTPSSLAIDYSKHEALIETLCRSYETQTTADVVYFSESRQKVTRRKIDPYAIHFDPQLEALYVFAWCHLRKEVRTFAVHRFRRAVLTAERFERPAEFTVEGFLRGAFRMWRKGNATRVRIRLRPGTGWVTERRWHASQRVTKRLRGGGGEIEFVVDSTRELVRFVLQLGPDAEVIEPLTLCRTVAELHAEAARRGFERPERVVSLAGKERGSRPRPNRRMRDEEEELANRSLSHDGSRSNRRSAGAT